jgi:hypothetical protein
MQCSVAMQCRPKHGAVHVPGALVSAEIAIPEQSVTLIHAIDDGRKTFVHVCEAYGGFKVKRILRNYFFK